MGIRHIISEQLPRERFNYSNDFYTDAGIKPICHKTLLNNFPNKFASDDNIDESTFHIKGMVKACHFVNCIH